MLARTSVVRAAHVNERETEDAPDPRKPTRLQSTQRRRRGFSEEATTDVDYAIDNSLSPRRSLLSRSGCPRLPVFIRFKNLKAAGIVENWPHLLALIEQQNFPAGAMLSPNVRAWNIEDVRQWLATRPTDRKVVRRRQVTQAAHQQNSILEGTSK
jgi:hypothetical protein